MCSVFGQTMLTGCPLVMGPTAERVVRQTRTLAAHVEAWGDSATSFHRSEREDCVSWAMGVGAPA